MAQRPQPPRTRPVSRIEPLECRRLMDARLGIGVYGFGQNSYGEIVQMLRDSGTTDVRLWYGFDSYGSRSTYKVVEYAKRFNHDGFNVSLSVNPRKGRHGTPEETRGFFEFLATQPGLAEAVDTWELGNEPDLEKYWKGSLESFVGDYVAPAARVLHNLGETVISGGVAASPGAIKAMVDVGLLRHVDMVGYHPYAKSVPQLKRQIEQVKSYVGNKPLVATEWNVRGHEKEDDKSAWADEVKDFWPVIEANFAIAHYFAAVTQDSMAGPAGVLTASGKHNNPFYGAYLSLQNLGNEDDGGDDNDEDDDAGPDDGNDGNGGDDGEQHDDDDQDGDGDDSGGNTSDGDDDASDGNGGSKGDTPAPPAQPGKGQAKPGKDDASDDDDEDADPGPGVTPVVVPDPPKPVIPPALTGLSLVNASRDRVSRPYASISGVREIDLADTGTAFLSVLASGNKKVGSVKFTLNGNSFVDSDGRFTLFGETADGDITGGSFLPNQTYTLVATPYSGPDATGRAGQVMSVVINVKDSANDPARAAASLDLDARRRREARANNRRRLTPVAVLPGL